MNEKHCPKCDQALPIERFSKNRANNTGYECYCKMCKSKNQKLHYHLHQEQEKERRKKYAIKGNGAFNNIFARCEKPNNKYYQYYGAKGIKCLISRKEFLAIYFSRNTCSICGVILEDNNRLAKNGRSLDRISVKGHYEKANLQVVCHSCNSSKDQKGEKNSFSRFTEQDILAIRHDYDNGMRLCDVCKKWNENRSSIWGIVHHRSWKHI